MLCRVVHCHHKLFYLSSEQFRFSNKPVTVTSLGGDCALTVLSVVRIQHASTTYKKKLIQLWFSRKSCIVWASKIDPEENPVTIWAGVPLCLGFGRQKRGPRDHFF